MGYLIQSIDTEDKEKVFTMINKEWNHVSKHDFDYWIENNSTAFFKINIAQTDEIIGCFQLNFTGIGIILSCLLLEKPYRRKGIGSNVLKNIFNKVIVENYKGKTDQEFAENVFLAADIKDVNLIKFYRKHGFQIISLMNQKNIMCKRLDYGN